MKGHDECGHIQPAGLRLWLVERLAWLITKLLPGFEVMVLSPCTVERIVRQRFLDAMTPKDPADHGGYI